MPVTIVRNAGPADEPHIVWQGVGHVRPVDLSPYITDGGISFERATRMPRWAAELPPSLIPADPDANPNEQVTVRSRAHGIQ